MTKPSRITVEKTYIAGMFGFAVIQIGSLAWDLMPRALVALAQVSPVPLPMPLQVDALLSSLCDAGVGVLITMGLAIGAIILVYMAIPDVFRGFAKRGSKSSGAQKQSGGDFGNAGFKLIGALVLASLPTLLSSAGFSLLSCVEAVQIFS